MAADGILRSYGDVSVRDSVLGLVEILTAEENQVMNMLGKSKAINVVHSTLTDTLTTAASKAVAEGTDYTERACTTPSRVTNLVEHIAVPFKVSEVQKEIEHYSGQDEEARQTTKALKDWANAAEFDLVRSTLVSGQSGVAPKMSGIIQAISQSTNYTAQSSGTVFSASILKGLMKANWDNSNGDVATDVLLGSHLKNKADDFTNKTTAVNTGSNAREVIFVTDIFETGLGKVRVKAHRYVQQSSDTTARVLGIRPDKLRVAYLRQPFIDNGLARSGGYTFKAVVGDMTLEVLNKNSNFFAIGYHLTS